MTLCWSENTIKNQLNEEQSWQLNKNQTYSTEISRTIKKKPTGPETSHPEDKTQSVSASELRWKCIKQETTVKISGLEITVMMASQYPGVK